MLSFASKSEFMLRRLVTMLDYVAWLLLDPSKFTLIKKSEVKKIVIIHLGAIGEVIASTPILPVLKRAMNAKITYLVPESKKELIENDPYVDKVLIYEDSFWKNVNNLKKEKFDMALVVHPTSMKMALTCILSGIRYRIGGFRGIKDGINLGFTRKMIDLRKSTAVQSNLDVIRTIGLDNKNPQLRLFISKKNREDVKNILKRLKVKDYVVIHPGSSFSTKLKYPSRSWPLKNYARVADFILDNYPVKVLITGGPGEHKLGEDVIRKMKNKRGVINISEGLSLGQVGALLSNTKLLIAPSTGIAHMALAIRAPTIHLSGPDGHHWRPDEDKNCIVLKHEEVCSGCEKIMCRIKTADCINAITVDEVINASKLFLNQKD